MANQRSLPIGAEHREFLVKVNGAVLERSHQLLAVTVTKAIDKISSARLVYLDGSAAASDFPLSNAPTFLPGQEVEILAGPLNDPVSLFKGIVVGQSLKVRQRTAPQLVVDCRHRAVTLTVGRKNAYFLEQKDSDICKSLLAAANLAGEVEETSVTHSQQVQYHCTDWDYILLRAQANGLLVFTNSEKVEIKKPVLSGSPVCTLLFGSTILEMDTEIDARFQFQGIQAASWDPVQQKVVTKEAVDPGVQGPGNLKTSDLAGMANLDHLQLQHPALPEDETQAWANSEWLRSQLSRINGRIQCEGLGTVNPGQIAVLAGAGDRFNGNIFITGLRHDFDLINGWKTHIQFGHAEKRLQEDAGISAPKASGLLPGVNGLQVGVVVSNEDPAGEHRVRVSLPLISARKEGAWARVASLDAGQNRGFFFRPEVGDEVVLGFLDDDPRQAVILGMLHSSAKAAPLKGSNHNHEKVYQSRSKMKLYFNDDKKILRLETPGGHKIILSEQDQAIRLEDQTGNKIVMNKDGIQIESKKALILKAGTEVKAESGTAFQVKAGTELKLQGAARAEISSASLTQVKGGMVNIN